MSNFDFAGTAGFPLADVNDWIARWKAVGGGFWCRQNGEGVEVQLARQVPSPDPDEITAMVLQEELLAQPFLKGAVTSFIADAWAKAKIAESLANMTPAGNA